MKANELRIGNYVNVANNARKDFWDCNALAIDGYYFEVSKLERFELNLYIDDEEIEVNYNDIKPIELTEEWAKKTGLLKGIGVHNDHFSGCVRLVYNDFIGLYEFYIGEINVKLLEYVHQLQNLYFALTNEELSI